MPLAIIDDLTTAGLVDRVSTRTIAILPVAATEPHGPHLPLSTDCDIAEGHIAALDAYLPAALDVVVLPLQRVGFSLEHSHFPGMQSRPVGTLVEDWMGLLRAYRALGGRRAVIVSSHGGNTPAVDALIVEARAQLDMLAVATAWLRFGQPEGLFSEAERKYGIHGGDIETSLMLHYAPEKVEMDKAADFLSRLVAMERRFTHLSAFGRHHWGWMSSDLNPHGVVGDATAASADKGAMSAGHALSGFVALLEDVAQFDLKLFESAKP